MTTSTRPHAEKNPCLATLCVWITEFGDPCHIMQEHLDHGRPEKWFVYVTDCEGKVVKWCGKPFGPLPATCGHVEIQVPPGCYTVFASHTAVTSGAGPFGNRLTHVQVVRVNCGDEVCVTLFAPEGWYCGDWFHQALLINTDGLIAAGVNVNLLNRAIGAIGELLPHIPVGAYSKNVSALVERVKQPS